MENPKFQHGFLVVNSAGISVEPNQSFGYAENSGGCGRTIFALTFDVILAEITVKSLA